ncbi:hypothetical protein QW060_26830 [Myroides ceti]|uniref:MFS transporter n=1 Tax=Paenimyroides ceti TaxID=395087 RepID=A0ABT8D0P7_9FLAO|nr:hypothetical protein [Paenimyroides ceti]MDN3710433.1 hypothetical protein [Paenimyroides ceti]
MCLSSMVVCLIIVYFTAHINIMAYIMAFITGLVAFTIGSPLQMMLIRNAQGAETLAASAGQASFNIGNTLGAYLGGIPIIIGYSYNTSVLMGAGMAMTGALLSFVFLKKFNILKKCRNIKSNV